MNPEFLIDGYKLDHRRQYPNGTQRVYANWTPRSSMIPGVDKVVFFGLQYFLQRYMVEEFGKFFSSNIDDICERYTKRVNGYLGANTIGTDHIRELHSLGCIPLVFKALPEGTRVPVQVPMFTVENTDDRFFWLTNYLETLLSSVIWLPCTSATLAVRLREMLNNAARRTGCDESLVQWQGHDFSFRGMAGPEAAALSGAGHLVAFTGSDTIPAIDFVEQYYGSSGLIAGSVPATEHSVMCAGGETSELDTFERILDLYPYGIVSVVSDTWDLWRVLTDILPNLKDRIMSRAGKLVIRPDSGDPADILCGDPNATGPAKAGVIQLLWDTFGGTVTSTGHKVLDCHIGAIYGDAITYDRAKAITERLDANGFASTNVVFGIGSFTYQYQTRDVFGFAMKATWVQVDGQGVCIHKSPVTGKSKKSARGRLAVIRDENDGELRLIDMATKKQEQASLLETVWENGKFAKTVSFDEVRSNALC